MQFLELPLSPLIWLMRQVLELAHGLTGSYGVSIILLSVAVTLATWPLAQISQRAEQREKALQDAMRPQIAEAKAKYRGEQQFNEIEKIYKAHRYHPIMALRSLGGLALQLPFLISALLLLIDHPPLRGAGWLFIADLSRPDGLLSLGAVSINLLPLAMVTVSLLDAWANPLMGREAVGRFVILAVGLFLLVYTLPAAVVLYWTSNNVWSFLRTLARGRRVSREAVDGR